MNTLVDSTRLIKEVDVPEAFSQQFDAAVQAYFGIQQALGTDDAEAAGTATAAMQDKLGSVDMGLLAGDGHMIWMDHLKNLNATLASMAQATTIEQQRETFYSLSQQLALTLRVFPVQPPVYQAFCPMAFDNAGATWLQQDDKILNPYFGTAMPGCGEIQGTIGADHE